MEGAHGMHSASMLERLKDPKIGQKSMTSIYTAAGSYPKWLIQIR